MNGSSSTHHRADEKEKAAIRAEIEALMKETNDPRVLDAILKENEGREDELLTNMRNVKEKAAIRAEVETLVRETNPPKSADELLETYAGKEDELIFDLQRMKADQVAVKEEVGG